MVKGFYFSWPRQIVSRTLDSFLLRMEQLHHSSSQAPGKGTFYGVMSTKRVISCGIVCISLFTVSGSVFKLIQAFKVMITKNSLMEFHKNVNWIVFLLYEFPLQPLSFTSTVWMTLILLIFGFNGFCLFRREGNECISGPWAMVVLKGGLGSTQ